MTGSLIGTRLGSYEITAKLGEGGMGEVYRATDTRLKRDVAIKVLPPGFTEDKERLARFEREAQLLAQLQHPNIASIFGLEESGGVRALVMELVEGPTLAERLEAGPLPIAESLSVSSQIAQALEEAHEKGIVHRDLKPQNVKASIEGKVKVLDFGLEKAMDPTGGASSAADLARSPTLLNSPTLTAVQGTQLGVILGTAAYMAPEQARGGAIDKRADIWSFGVVVYEMLCGRSLFAGETVTDTLAAVLTREVDWNALPAATPAAIRGLLRRCLERNPKNRLRDIGDARLVIDEVIRGGSAIETERTIAAPRHSTSRQVVAAWVAAGIFAAIGIGLGAFVWRQRSAAPTVPRFEKLTYAPQFISNARFAADGRTVVLSAAREGNTSELFVRHPEDPQPRTLGRPDTQLLAVSSKGELALLTRARYQTHRTYLGTLARMPLAEASPREVLNDVTAADWSPDGAELAVIRQVEGKSRLEYPLGTVLAETTGYLSDVRVSPQGDLIAYMPHAFALDNRGRVVIADRAGKVVATSPAEYWGEEGIAWSADGKEVLYSALDLSQGQEFAIHALALDGTVRMVLAAPTGLILHDRTPDGRLLVSTHIERGAVVALFPGAAAERDLPWLEQSYLPVLSRDGRSLLFGDSSALSGDLYSVLFRAADGSPPVRLGEGIGTDLSPDGAVVVAVVMDDPPRLMIYPTGAGEPRDISAAGFVAYGQSAHFFREGRSVAFCGNEAGMPSRCYVRDLAASGPARAVTPEGTRQGRVSPDGTAVVARGTDGRYRRYLLDGGEGVPVPGLGDDDEIVCWRSDGRSLLVCRRSEIPVRVDRLDLATGQRTLLRELAPADRAGLIGLEEVSFSADEKSYAYGIKRVVGTLYAVEGVR